MWMLRNRIRIITDYGKSVVTGIGCNAFYFGRETQTHLIKRAEYGINTAFVPYSAARLYVINVYDGNRTHAIRSGGERSIH